MMHGGSSGPSAGDNTTVHTHLGLHPNLEEHKCLLLEVELLAWQHLAQR